MNDWEIESADVSTRGHRIRVFACGPKDAPAIVWLHGSGPGAGAMSNWAHLLPRFAPGYYSIAPDVLGFADSEHPEPPPAGMKEFTRLRAESIVGMLDELGVEKANFVGNSMGGIITLAVAQIAPERIDRMVLMGSGGAPGTPTPELLKLITFYDDPSVQAMADLLTAFVYDPGLFAGELDSIAAERLEKANRPEVRRSHLATFDMTDGPVGFTPEDLAVLPHEALVLHGREDRLLPLAGGYYLAQNLPNAQLHVLPHTGHWIQIEQADRFTDQLRTFLDEGRAN